MRISVCKDCTDRKVGCHSTCERYIQDKARHDQLRKEIRISKELACYEKDRRLTDRARQIRKYGKSRV